MSPCLVAKILCIFTFEREGLNEPLENPRESKLLPQIRPKKS